MKHWKEYAIAGIRKDIDIRKHNLSSLQLKRDQLQAEYHNTPNNDALLSDIMDINKKIRETKKPILQRQLFLSQGIRRR